MTCAHCGHPHRRYSDAQRLDFIQIHPFVWRTHINLRDAPRFTVEDRPALDIRVWLDCLIAQERRDGPHRRVCMHSCTIDTNNPGHYLSGGSTVYDLQTEL